MGAVERAVKLLAARVQMDVVALPAEAGLQNQYIPGVEAQTISGDVAARLLRLGKNSPQADDLLALRPGAGECLEPRRLP